MTMLTDFDRLLGSVLEADGPQAVPPGLVDAALIEARTVDQRRPFVRMLDQLAWPPLVGPLPRRATRRMATLALVALLVIVAIAAAVFVGASRPPQVLGDGERAYVWFGDTAVLMTTGGAIAHTITPGRNITACPTLIAGTTVVAHFGYGGWDLVDLLTDQPVSSVEIPGAGAESWSPDARRMAILDAAGRVGIATFEDVTEPVTVWHPAPGVRSMAWSHRGDRLAFLTQLGPALTVEVLDVESGDRQVVYRTDVEPIGDFSNGPLRDLHWSSDGPTMALRIVAIDDGTTVTLLDTVTGEVALIEGIGGASGFGPYLPTDSALTLDGSAFAIVASPTQILISDAHGRTLGTVLTTQPATGLAWSSDGERLAYRDGDALVVVARDGTARRTALVGTTAAFRWDADGLGLLVATARTGSAAIERYETDTLTPVARLDSPASGIGGSPFPEPSAVDGEASVTCLQVDMVGPAPPGDP